MCSVSTVKNPVALANLYRLQSIATDNKKTMHSVSTVLGVEVLIQICWLQSLMFRPEKALAALGV